MVPDAVLIYMLPPDAATLAGRLRGRGTETDDVIRGRLKAAAGEARHIGDYDYVIVNDDAEQCAVRLNGLIEAQRLRTARNLPFIKEIQEGLEREARDN
jgi:guanylate kinase